MESPSAVVDIRSQARVAAKLLEGQPKEAIEKVVWSVSRTFSKTNGKGGFIDVGLAVSEMLVKWQSIALEAERKRSEPVEDKSEWNNPTITDDDIPF